MIIISNNNINQILTDAMMRYRLHDGKIRSMIVHKIQLNVVTLDQNLLDPKHEFFLFLVHQSITKHL